LTQEHLQDIIVKPKKIFSRETTELKLCKRLSICCTTRILYAK
jgi:hypothetical protein